MELWQKSMEEESVAAMLRTESERLANEFKVVPEDVITNCSVDRTMPFKLDDSSDLSMSLLFDVSSCVEDAFDSLD